MSIAALLAGFIICSFLLYGDLKALTESGENRYKSYLLADELRQSSDDLTRMVRTFAATGDKHFEDQFKSVLAIRNGEQPRPKYYNRIYWDFLSIHDGQSNKPGEQKSLKDLMIAQGINKDELALLGEAQDQSDALVNLERVAMSAINNNLNENDEKYRRPGESNRNMALRLLHGQEYHQAKARIMAPIQEFFIKLDERTEVRFKQIANQSLILIVVCVVLVVIGVFLAIIAMFVSKRINELEHKKIVDINRELDFQKFALDEHAIVSIADVKGNISYVNDNMCEISGYSREELLGQNHRMLKSDEHPPEFFVDIWKAIANGDVWHGEIKNKKKDGGYYWVGSTIVPFLDERGKPFKYVGIRTDISKRKNAEEKARAADRSKSDFLANMSHEIRTPMNAIIGMTNIGIRDSTDVRGKETFIHILDSSQHLLGVINDILDFSKIEAGKLSTESRPFQLFSAVEDSVNMFTERAQARGLKLSVNLPRDLPVWVLGDSLRLQQILLNLLSNAIKFTSEGEVCVFVSRDGNITRFTTTDTGIGLSDEQVSRLFTPFEQADASTTREFGGTGLGLAISYNLAHLMGGDLSVESQLHEGSVFTLSLPLDEINAPDIKHSVTSELSGPKLEGLHILAAEDVDINRLILEDMLEQESASVVFAEDGQQAIDRLLQIGADQIDIILMDVQMPVMDGYEATRQILAMAPNIPIIGVTAHALKEEHDKCLAVGMVAHVTKPIDADVLISTILRHVK